MKNLKWWHCTRYRSQINPTIGPPRCLIWADRQSRQVIRPTNQHGKCALTRPRRKVSFLERIVPKHGCGFSLIETIQFTIVTRRCPIGSPSENVLLFCFFYYYALSVYRPRTWTYATAFRPGKIIILCVANANRISSETKRFVSFLPVFLMNKLRRNRPRNDYYLALYSTKKNKKKTHSEWYIYIDLYI